MSGGNTGPQVDIYEFYGDWVGNNDFRCAITAFVDPGGTSSTVRVWTYIETPTGSSLEGKANAGATVDGSTQTAINVDYSGTTLLCKKSVDVLKGMTEKQVDISGYVITAMGESSYSGTVPIPAMPVQFTTYSISYNANGGTGAPVTQVRTIDTPLAISSVRPTRNGYTFVGWNTASDGTGTSYNPGSSYTYSGITSVTLYAQWRADPPALNVTESYRSDSNRNADDDGTYITVACAWSQADSTIGGNVTIEAVMSERGNDPAAGDPTASTTESGTSGLAFLTVGAGTVVKEKAYTITVSATSSMGTTTVKVDVGEAWYPIDFFAGGHGVAIGGVAKADGLAVNMDETVNGDLAASGNGSIGGNLSVSGNNTVDGDLSASGNGSIDGTLDVGGRLSVGSGSATTEADIYARLANRHGRVLRMIDHDGNGSAVLMGNGGLTVVGGGESADALYNALIGAGSTPGTEQLHLASDNNLYLHSNCNAIANRKSVSLSTDGNMYNSGGGYYSDSDNLTMNTTPSATATGEGITFRDSAPTWIGRLVPRFLTNNNEVLLLESRRVVSGTSKYAQLFMGLDPSGNVVVSVGGTGAAKAWKDALDTCNATAIFTGKNVSNGGTIGTYTSVFDYRLFWAQLSGNNNNWCLCYRTGSTSTAGYIRGVGSLDTGTNSYVFKTNISVSTAGVLKVVASSQHLLGPSGNTGTGLYVSALYGIK